MQHSSGAGVLPIQLALQDYGDDQDLPQLVEWEAEGGLRPLPSMWQSVNHTLYRT